MLSVAGVGTCTRSLNMADILIVYYSLEGNIDFVARTLAKKTGANLCRLETVKEYPKKGLLKFLHGGKDSLSGFKPELKTVLPDVSAYKTIVIGAPVWAGKPAAPINTYLDTADFSGKRVFVFTSSAGGSPAKALELMSAMVAKKGAVLGGTAAFVNPIRTPAAAVDAVGDFAKKITG